MLSDMAIPPCHPKQHLLPQMDREISTIGCIAPRPPAQKRERKRNKPLNLLH